MEQPGRLADSLQEDLAAHLGSRHYIPPAQFFTSRSGPTDPPPSGSFACCSIIRNFRPSFVTVYCAMLQFTTTPD